LNNEESGKYWRIMADEWKGITTVDVIVIPESRNAILVNDCLDE